VKSILRITLAAVVLALLAGCVSTQSAFTNFSRQDSGREHSHRLVTAPEPVRAGSRSQRFELRPGDCDSFSNGWDDCTHDRERIEFTAQPSFQIGQEVWIAYSIYVPRDFSDLTPVHTHAGQIHQRGGPSGTMRGLPSNPPLIQFDFWRGSYQLNHHRLTGDINRVVDNSDFTVLASLSQMRGRWTDILLHLKFSRDDGFAHVYVNGTSKARVTRNFINFEPREFFFKFGIYRSFLSKLNQPPPTQVLYFDEVRAGPTRESVDLRTNPDLSPVD